MKDKLNLQLKDNMVRSCLLANTVLRDVISTPLLWRNFQTTKLFGSPVFYWILTHADDWFKSRNENLTNPFATFRRKKKRQTFFFKRKQVFIYTLLVSSNDNTLQTHSSGEDLKCSCMFRGEKKLSTGYRNTCYWGEYEKDKRFPTWLSNNPSR